MRRLRSTFLAGCGALLAAASAGCTAKVASTPSQPASTPPPPPAHVCSAPQGSAADAQELAGADTAFALAFYGPAVAAAGAAKNVIVSPYTVSASLTMVDTGAAGQTDAQLRSVLHLPNDATNMAPAFAALACATETDGAAQGDELSLANAVWAQQGKTFEPAFLATLAGGYDAALLQADFAGDTATAAGDVNAWVSQETQGRIPALLRAGDIDERTRMVLVDALYFKGTWQTGFDPGKTASKPFTLEDGSTVSVPTMDGVVTAKTGFISDRQLNIVELSYRGGALAMDLFIDNQATPVATLESALTPESLVQDLASLGTSLQAEVLLPKFSFTTHLELAPVLSGMGMPDLFDDAKADLSGMDGAMDLSVGEVVQEAMVEVDESGTVAAAATSVQVCQYCLALEEPAVLTFDRPFIFLIRDTTSGAILFMGHVQDPRQP